MVLLAIPLGFLTRLRGSVTERAAGFVPSVVAEDAVAHSFTECVNNRVHVCGLAGRALLRANTP